MQISDFKLIRMIGKGALGDVWLAQYIKTKSYYALKFMDFKNAPVNIIESLKLAKTIDHPNLMELYEYFYEKTMYGNNIIIVCEYVKGENLYDKIKNNHSIDIDEIINQTLDGLNYLHKKKIIHRDIKPENIIINRNVIKIIDYDFLIYNNKAKGKAGTPYYLAPEIYLQKYYDHRVDIWSLGILIWCCLEGRETFDAENRKELKIKVLNDEPDWSQIDDEKMLLVLKGCLKKNPDNRLSIKQIKELLNNY